MSTDRPSPPAQQPKGLVPWMLGIVAGMTVSFVCALLVGTVLEWVGMNRWWQEEGVQHSKNVVDENLAYLNEYRRSVMTPDTVELAASWSDAAETVAHKIGLVKLIQKGAEPLPPEAPNDSKARRWHGILSTSLPYLLAMIYVWKAMAIRLCIAYLALPALALAFVLGLIDGLSRRDIRKWAGGRESSFIFHHSKQLLWPAFTFGFFVYMAWPNWGVNPAWMVLPFCAAAACNVSLMAATFKKYL